MLSISTGVALAAPIILVGYVSIRRIQGAVDRAIVRVDRDLGPPLAQESPGEIRARETEIPLALDEEMELDRERDERRTLGSTQEMTCTHWYEDDERLYQEEQKARLRLIRDGRDAGWE